MGSTSIGEAEYVLYGKANIVEVLRGLTFQISANSFFQTNTQQVCVLIMQFSCDLSQISCWPALLTSSSLTVQAEVLYKLIEDVVNLRGDGSEIVLDLFCGTGTIGLTLARRFATEHQTLLYLVIWNALHFNVSDLSICILNVFLIACIMLYFQS